MFENEAQMRAFILWAKETKLKRFKLGEIEVEFSDLAFIDPVTDMPEVTDFEQKTLVDTEPVDQKEENELLFWSSR
jgi:hypothetical protein